MIRYLTAREIADLIRRPVGTIYRWASVYGWRRSDDSRRPVLYLAEDVEKTLRSNTPTDAT